MSATTNGPPKRKAAGRESERLFQQHRELDLTLRLGKTKRLLVEAYNWSALSLVEAETMASRLRTRFGDHWVQA